MVILHKRYVMLFFIFGHLKRRFLYSENYIKIIYYITLMNNEELIEEIHILAKKIIHYNNCMITYYCLTYVKKKSYCDHILQYCVIQTNNPQMLALRNSNSQLIHGLLL